MRVFRGTLQLAMLTLPLLCAAHAEAGKRWIPGWAATDLTLPGPNGTFRVTVNEIGADIPRIPMSFAEAQMHRDIKHLFLEQMRLMAMHKPPNPVVTVMLQADAPFQQFATGSITCTKGDDVLAWPSDLTIAIVTTKKDTIPATTILASTCMTTGEAPSEAFKSGATKIWFGGRAVTLYPGGTTIRVNEMLTDGSCRYVAVFPRQNGERSAVKRYIWYRTTDIPGSGAVNRAATRPGVGGTTNVPE